MTFEKQFDIYKEFFDPSVYFPGTIIIGSYPHNQVLIGGYIGMNAHLINKSNNKFYSLMNKLYKPTMRSIKNEYLRDTLNRKLSLVEGEDGKRKIIFSLSECLLESANLVRINQSRIDELRRLSLSGANSRLLAEKFAEILREKISIYNDVLTNKSESEYYKEISDEHKSFMYDYRKDNSYRSLNLNEYINSQISNCSLYLNNLEAILELFSNFKELNPKSLIECFKYDKLCLMIAKSVLDSSVAIDNPYTSAYVANYLEAVKKI